MNILHCLTLLATLVSVQADYKCLCNYNVELPVRQQPDSSSATISYMYEFDCKPNVNFGQQVDGWITIGTNNQLGYVKFGPNVEMQICPGNPPQSDIVTTQATSTPSVQPSTKSAVTTATHKPTSTPVTTLSTSQSTTTSTIAPTTAPSSSTTPSQSTPSTSRVSMTTLPVTNLTNITTSQPTSHSLIVGNTTLCPSQLHRYTMEDQGALTQYGNRCFEIVPIRAIWAKAENDCRAKGGHLIHIDDKAQQDFIYKWIKSYNFDHAVWTGLHDLINEEYFQWISGDHLLYTNWYPDRYGNLASHHIENCVLLVPYKPYYGRWDDVQCGIHTMFGDSGQQNPFICEYLISPHHKLPIIVG